MLPNFAFEDAVRNPRREQVIEYLRLSLYTESLCDLESLAPGRLLAPINEDLRHRRTETLERVWRFIGVNPGKGTIDPPAWRRSLLARLRQRCAPRDYPPMAPTTRAQLLEQFKDEVDALEAGLARDLTAWRT